MSRAMTIPLWTRLSNCRRLLKAPSITMFEGKDALLSSLSMLFDEKYEELIPTLTDDMDSFEKLLYLNQ